MINYKKRYWEIEATNRRNLMKFQLLNQWMKLKLKGIWLKEFFGEKDVHSIAIYGMGEIGQLFYEELKISNAEKLVNYGIDQSAKKLKAEIPLYELEESLPKVDAIVITPVLITDAIEDAIYETLGEQTTFVFEEVLYELSRKYRVPSELWEI